MLEVLLAIVAKLEADPVYMTGLTGVYDTVVPPRTAMPYAVVSELASVPDYVQGDSQPVIDEEVYLVKVVTNGYNTAYGAAKRARARAILNDAALSASGRSTLYIRADGQVRYAQPTEDGPPLWHQGERYRTITEPS